MKPSVRMAVLNRDNFTCRYCGRQAPTVKLEVDHIRPRSKGGEDDVINLATACWDCNRGKKAQMIRPPGKRERAIGIDKSAPDYWRKFGIETGKCGWCGDMTYDGVGGSAKARDCFCCHAAYHIDCYWLHKDEVGERPTTGRRITAMQKEIEG